MKSFLFLFSILTAYMVLVRHQVNSTRNSLNLFSEYLFEKLVHDQRHKNVVFSPYSIQNGLILVLMGAGSKTAEELCQSLSFPIESDKVQSAQNFCSANNGTYRDEPDGAQMKTGNRIYVNNDFQLVPQFSEIATKYFEVEVNLVDFDKTEEAVQLINTWVEEKTEHQIQNIIKANTVNPDTITVLVSWIYFNGTWKESFNLPTVKQNFRNCAKQKVSVDMMHTRGHFQYARLPDLDATAVEIKYNNSGLSMLIILPNRVDGLYALEKKLAGHSLTALVEEMKSARVEIFLPKFAIEYEVNLNEPLKQLGMTTMFSDEADFKDFVYTDPTQPVQPKISKVVHKAFLAVNEEGQNVPTVKQLKHNCDPTMLKRKYIFRAGHPFVFVIRSPFAIYLMGHVAKL